MSSSCVLRIATRASQLALWQARWAAARLGELGVATELVEVSTRGDREQLDPLSSLGGTGLFTKEIQTAVLSGQADVAVHSLKDLPTAASEGLALVATPPREDASDALVVARGPAATLADLPPGARVGTGSARRRAQLLLLRPDLELLPIRGNVDTRLRKLDAGEYDAIVLAAAGLVRLGWEQRISERLAPPRLLPAPGQGALALECRSDDEVTGRLVAVLDDEATRAVVTAERRVLARLEGGCSAPLGAWGRVADGLFQLDAVVVAADGRNAVRSRRQISCSSVQNPTPLAEPLAEEVVADLLQQGAAELLASA